MKPPMHPKNEMIESLFLLIWGSVLGAFSILFLFMKHREYTEKKGKSVLIELPVAKKSVQETEQSIYKKRRTRVPKKTMQDEAEYPLLDSFKTQRDERPHTLIVVKNTKKRNSDTSTLKPALLLDLPQLPAKIVFSDQFVFPSLPDAEYKVYPLPGQERSNPVARINGQLIYNTQFGVLTTHDVPDESHVAAHQRCLENGQVVFTKDIGLFKTHPVKTAGDERVYATHQIATQDGLTLHLFDSAKQHAHHRK